MDDASLEQIRTTLAQHNNATNRFIDLACELLHLCGAEITIDAMEHALNALIRAQK